MAAREDSTHLTLEDALDALVDADRRFAPGTARAVLSNRLFRSIYFGAFVSNIGTWMQNAVLGAFAFRLSGSATFVGVIVFAQLGPMLFLSIIGGALADRVDRRRLMIGVAIEQMALSLVLAWITLDSDPSRVVLVLIVLAIGAGQAVHAPTYSAALPALVPREDLSGAISLNSTQMNASRVIGPAVGGILFATVGVSWVFTVNAASYLIIIAVLLAVRLPPVAAPSERRGLAHLAGGLRVARRDPIVGGILATMAVFALLALPFVTQMPTIAERNLGIAADSVAYGLLYACLSLGAVAGSLATGTFLADTSRGTVVRYGFGAYAAGLAVLSLLETAGPAYIVVVFVGFAYFAVVTSLATVLQTQIDDNVRGRVMALWIMSFGGMVPIGGLVAGVVMEATSPTVVMLFGAGTALVLAWFARRYSRSHPPEPLAI